MYKYTYAYKQTDMYKNNKKSYSLVLSWVCYKVHVYIVTI